MSRNERNMFNHNIFLNINLMTNLRWFWNWSFDFINKHLLCINESRENYHKLGNLVIWWFCVHVNSSKLFTIPTISLWWMRLWMKSWTIYLFWIFTTSKERKTKGVKGTKGFFFLGKKMGPKSQHYEEKKPKVMFDLVYKKRFQLVHIWM